MKERKLECNLIITIVLIVLMTSGCVSSSIETVKRINNYSLSINEPLLFHINNNELYIGYHGKDDQNYYIKKLADFEDIKVSYENAKGTGHVLAQFNEEMYLAWRAKYPNSSKYIYLQKFDRFKKVFEKPIVINNSDQALAPIAFPTSESILYILWLDERSKTSHDIYMNYSTDKGKTFLKEDILLTEGIRGAGIFSVVVRGKRIDLFFIGISKRQDIHFVGYQLFNKYSEDGGITWSEPKLVHEDKGWTPYVLHSLNIGDKIFLVWAGKGIFTAHSNNDGMSWETKNFGAASDKQIYGLSVVNFGKKIYLSSSYQDDTSLTNKSSVFFYKSEDGGITWSEPVKINTNKFANSSAVEPAIAISKNTETVIVTWRDHRNIRGKIYMNYSLDGGKTWLKEDIFVEEDDIISKYNSISPKIIEINGEFYVFWLRFEDDKMEDANIYYRKLNITNVKGR